MSAAANDHPVARIEIVRWAARLGAVTAAALAVRDDSTVTAARMRLTAAERHGLLVRDRPLTAQPALYRATRSGIRLADVRGLAPAQISPAIARHAIACAYAAAALERSYPDHRVGGERELRRDERESGKALASARLGQGCDGPLLHRPDIVLWPPGGGRPIAVEVELTVKAPRRLLAICRAWARCSCVEEVLYLVSAEVRAPLDRAIAGAQAASRIAVLACPAPSCDEQGSSSERTIPVES